MARRLPASMRTREELTSLIEGRLSTASAKDELVKLATRLIIEEGLEGEAGDAVGRDYYEHGPLAGQGYRNGYRTGRLKTAAGAIEYSAPQVVGREEPYHSAIREHLTGHTRALEESRCWRAGFRSATSGLPSRMRAVGYCCPSRRSRNLGSDCGRITKPSRSEI
jgi:putative transposase